MSLRWLRNVFLNGNDWRAEQTRRLGKAEQHIVILEDRTTEVERLLALKTSEAERLWMLKAQRDVEGRRYEQHG